MNRNIKLRLPNGENKKSEEIEKAIAVLSTALGLKENEDLFIFKVGERERNIPLLKGVKSLFDIERLYTQRSFQYAPETAVESAEVFSSLAIINNIIGKRRKKNSKEWKARKEKKEKREQEKENEKE